MRKSFKKYQPKKINYSLYETFSNEKYGETLINNSSKENFINNDDGFQRFCHISVDASNKYAKGKKKHARGNQMFFLNKELSKAIMTRTKLRHLFLQNRIEENRIFENKTKKFLCLSFKKNKEKIL